MGALAADAVARLARDMAAARSASGTTVVDNTIIECASTRWVDLARHGRRFGGSTCPVAVSRRTSQFWPNSAAGMVNLIGSVWALKSSRKWSSEIGRPTASSAGMASPLKRPSGCGRIRNSILVHLDASGEPQDVAELTSPPCWHHRRRTAGGSVSDGPFFESIAAEVKASKSFWSASRSQSTQSLVVLGVHIAVLGAAAHLREPASERLTPIMVVMKFRYWSAQSDGCGISSLAFTPQFHDRLWLSPSPPFSPLASLCSCGTPDPRVQAVMSSHGVDRGGRTPVRCAYRSRIGNRDANSASDAGSPRQKSRHDVAVLAVPLRPQGRKVAHLIVAVAQIQGSAISLT